MSAIWFLLALAHPPWLSAEWRWSRQHPPLVAPETVRLALHTTLFRRLSFLPALPAPLALREEAVYRVSYGAIGSIGQLRLSIADERTEGGRRLIKVAGRGEGSILGLGRSEKSVDAEFDPATLGARRWTMIRTGGDDVTDTIDQPQAGVLRLARQKPGAPPSTKQVVFSAATPTMDPVGLLMRLRAAPPVVGQPVVLQILDGQALWRVTLTAVGRQTLPETDGRVATVRVDGRADPIYYDGRDADDRPRRTFAVWLSDDDARVPLRLTMPIGIADVVIQLVEATRTPRAP
ncbi:MAG TPA: DUF3108 domain-containing protein [Polyangia bacterium]|jgi:hypothetical protein|nr:DUF3108 domain-containing protein [Polyangia bacterium]